MRLVSRLLMLAGAAGMVLAALLPWVTINGLHLDLGVLGALISPGARTVAGTDTSIWPAIVGVGVIVAVLAIVGVAHKLALALGVVAIGGGAALWYYCANVVDIKSREGGEIERALADALISSTTGPGTPLLVASGVVIVIGALLAR